MAESDGMLYVGIVIGAFILVGMIAALTISLVWVYRDAVKRGHTNAGLIAFMCFLCNWPFSLFFFVIMRNPELGQAHTKIEP